jgi:predicted HTH transcriptional regulator
MKILITGTYCVGKSTTSKMTYECVDNSILITRYLETHWNIQFTENRQLKRAAVILFGKDPGRFYPNTFVKIGHFGKNDSDLRFQEVEERNIIVLKEGLLPEGISLESLRHSHSSRPRNPLIADVCFKGGLIDTWGSGTIRNSETCKEAELPEPELIERDGGFLVTLFKNNLTEEQLKKLGLNERQVDAISFYMLGSRPQLKEKKGGMAWHCLQRAVWHKGGCASLDSTTKQQVKWLVVSVCSPPLRQAVEANF